ncbi:hypothetical protein A2529_04720 [Candidatus Peribacteria bacterium RIFOXYD2_FULL_58_15]|nr:MAG: hypothetical protein A2529_04720 [Candidatus Peribacteria bacterium RIFOXYD2_FULL_58_15]
MLTHLTKRSTVYAAFLLALYWVVTLWGIWSKGVDALGWNLTFFVACMIMLYAHAQRRSITRRELVWFIPLLLVALSYSLYENPYVKAVNMAVLPILFASYWIMTSTRQHQTVVWNLLWVKRLLERGLGIVGQGQHAVSLVVCAVIPGGERRSDLVKRIALGCGIFAAAASILFIPLLSGADSAFANMMQDFYRAVIAIIAFDTIMKIVVFIVLSLLILAGLIQWTKEEEFSGHTDMKHMDAVVSGIVLGGILLLYVLFLFTQLQTLWVYELPQQFLDTEQLVKSGFWQLFFLSGINVLLFLLYYRRTSKPVQTMLIAFMFASLFLLLSAAKRMGMYVFYYGFSYEKFFAAYTVVFAVFLFVRLITALFQSGKTDILRYLVIAFIWMYAVATILPVEQMIFRANRALARRADSRIDMLELRMLSGDVYDLAGEESLHNADWNDWLAKKSAITDEKRFYEFTLTDVLLRARKSWNIQRR